ILSLAFCGRLAAYPVGAEPIRVVLDGASKTNANLRLGHALANTNVNGNDDSARRLVRPSIVMIALTKIKSENRHFCGASLREKAIHVSNTFQHTLGLPLIKTNDHAFKSGVVDKWSRKHGGVHILPMCF
ncbi:hypothetical protein BJ138DRAFT_982427, partial [Hygrophoropsis aurantiaca]